MVLSDVHLIKLKEWVTDNLHESETVFYIVYTVTTMGTHIVARIDQWLCSLGNNSKNNALTNIS